MKRFLFLVLVALSLTAFAQEQNEVKRIAILETVNKSGDIPEMKLLMFRSNLTTAITNTKGYEGYDRINLEQILDEHKFQRTGLVSDEDIVKIGKFTGAQYVLIAEAAMEGKDMFITAKLIDVKTTHIVRNSNRLMKVTAEDMQRGSLKVAADLLGVEVSTFSPDDAYRLDYAEDAYGINMKMIWVEGGEFMMGCTSDQGYDCDDDEKNVRRVTIDGFYIGMLEVTQSQWEKVTGKSIYEQRGKIKWSLYDVGPNYPVFFVSWKEAKEFCRLLSNKTGKNYDLPTEAQWEYAARGGRKAEGTKYAGSNNIDDVAWYSGNGGEAPHPCGTKRPNALGIYDMSGNVGEWCKDWYSNNYLKSSTNNPAGPISGTTRVFRGGSLAHEAGGARVAIRFYGSPDIRLPIIGFRVVCIP